MNLRLIDLVRGASLDFASGETETDSTLVASVSTPTGDTASPKRPVAQLLIETAESVADLFTDDRGKPHAAVTLSGIRRNYPVSSSAFGEAIAGELWAREGMAASNEAISSAKRVLAHKAAAGHRHTLHNRFAYVDGALWIDLADDRQHAVRVTAHGWTVQQPPILFRRYRRQAALPMPATSGDIHRIARYLNTQSDTDRTLMLTWLVTSMLGQIPRPILDLHGPQGSAKTTAAKILRRLTDPSAAPTCYLSSRDDELALTLETNAVPLFDNVTSISGRQADLLCQAVTGGGFSKRELYSDSDEIVYDYRRAIIITGINVASVAPDLLDRFLLVQLDRIGRDARRAEGDLWRSVESDAPVIFAGMLDTLSKTLQMMPGVSVPLVERMADFTQWGAVVAEVLGIGKDPFLGAYRANVTGLADEILESDPVARTVRDLIAAETEWSGTPTELLTVLRDRAGEREARHDGWPKRADALSRRIRTLQSTLADIGIGVNHRRQHGGIRSITLFRTDAPTFPREASPVSPRHHHLESRVTPVTHGDASSHHSGGEP